MHCALGTYCNPGGQPDGVAVEALEEDTGEEVHWMGLTMSSLEIMGSGSSWFSSGAWSRERASALIFIGPGG